MSEAFLQRIMALYVASHYKNTPNDLQMLSDAPAHRLFVLLGRVPETGLPDVLCVAQVCLEGAISRPAAARALGRAGAKQSGDLLPWTVAQQFQDPGFASLSGARVVRIATHPARFFRPIAIHLLLCTHTCTHARALAMTKPTLDFCSLSGRLHDSVYHFYED